MQRHGFSLIELLVVVGIIGVLLGLLLPAISLVQESARQAECKSNLRQVALAFHEYHDVQGGFPANHYANGNEWSPFTRILPYCEQQNVYAELQLDVPLTWQWFTHGGPLDQMVPLFRCPNQPNATGTAFDLLGGVLTVAVTTYAVSGGATHAISASGKPIFADGAMPLLDTPRTSTLRDISDGTSNTILLGEIRDAVAYNHVMVRDWIEFSTTASSYEAVNSDEFHTFGSAHRIPGMNISLADGSVHFYRQNVSLGVLRALTTRADSETVDWE